MPPNTPPTTDPTAGMTPDQKAAYIALTSGSASGTNAPGTTGNSGYYLDPAGNPIPSYKAQLQVTRTVTVPPAPGYVSPAQAQEAQQTGQMPAATTTQDVPSTYYDALSSLTTMDPAKLKALQQELLAGGFYTAGYYSGRHPIQVQFGVPDAATISAFEKALGYAVQPGAGTLEEEIQKRVADREKGGAGALPVQLPVHIDLTNPEDLITAFQDAATKETGRRFTPDQLTSMVSAFQTLESQAQTQQQQDQLTGAGGTTTKAPTADAFAQSQLMQTQGAAVGGTRLAGIADVMLNMIKGGVPSPSAAGGVPGT